MPEESAALDRTDREIVAALQRDGRVTWLELGRRVNLSANATAERVRRLQARGIIVGFRAVVDPAALGRHIDAVVGVRAQPGADRAPLEAWLAGQPTIVETLHLTGAHDYLLRVRCRTAAELDELLMAMKAETAVADTETRVVLRSIAPRIDE